MSSFDTPDGNNNPFENNDVNINKIVNPLLNDKWSNKNNNEYKNHINPFLNKKDN